MNKVFTKNNQLSNKEKNGFGGVIINSIKAKIDLNGNILKILEQ